MVYKIFFEKYSFGIKTSYSGLHLILCGSVTLVLLHRSVTLYYTVTL